MLGEAASWELHHEVLPGSTCSVLPLQTDLATDEPASDMADLQAERTERPRELLDGLVNLHLCKGGRLGGEGRAGGLASKARSAAGLALSPPPNGTRGGAFAEPHLRC